MKNYSKEELKKIYNDRVNNLRSYMFEKGIDTVVFCDNEDCRDINIRYFTGHPSDAIFIVSLTNGDVLIPWDENLANQFAFADRIVPWTRYERDTVRAVKGAMSLLKINDKTKVEIPPTTPYPLFLEYVDALAGYEVRCRNNSVHEFVTAMRAVKDEYEIECTKEAAKIGDKIIELIEKQVKNGKIKTETDVALLIEAECRKYGCERTGFDTLAAGPDRSYAIHCFPNYTNGQWPGNGLNILDFGVVYNGYTSDTTLTIAKGRLSKDQLKLIELVETAAEKCLELYKKDVPLRAAAAKADEIFAKAKKSMPHGLGHGIGLEIHEYPFVRGKANIQDVFAPGMIVTLEPGLYDPKLGGVRLENDVLVTQDGNEVITHSKIIYL